MTPGEGRPPLGAFLTTSAIRTGDRLEAAALAEMAGYTVADAQAEGWPDVFRASAAVAIPVDRQDDTGPPAAIHPGLHALVRGLIYTAPVLALAALFPVRVADAELRFLAVVVVLSWGGSMASNHVVGTWLWGDAAVAWRRAVVVALLATLGTVVVASALWRSGAISGRVALLGVTQATYFFSASPLMLRPRRVGLAVCSVLGAGTGLALILGRTGLIPEPVGDRGSALLQVVAVTCLLAPALLLVRQAVASRRAGAGRPVTVVRRDTVAFAVYGASFACLVLWGPVVMPGSVLTLLMLVVVAGIAIAELAVSEVHERAARLLDEPYVPNRFARRARWIVVSGTLAYLAPVSAAVLVGSQLVAGADGWVARAPAVAAVCTLGLVQMLSLIGMALHGIRTVAVAIGSCSAGILMETWLVDGSAERLLAYGLALGLAAVWLIVAVMRLCIHPINLL